MPEKHSISQSQETLVEQIIRFTKGFHRMKATLAREMPDRAAYNLLYPLAECDKRASDLADIVHSDPSTVSRHIASLVGNGLVQRVADQNDGRATLVSLTTKGRNLCETLRNQRESVLTKMLSTWSEEDSRQLAHLLTRLNDDMEANSQELIDGFRRAFDDVEAGSQILRMDKENT